MWHVGYVKRSRPHVHSPRSLHHLQPISNVHFKRTAKHTNRNREPFGGFRGSEGDDMWSWHVGYVKRSRPHVYSPRSPHHLQPISNVHFKRTAEHTNRDREIIWWVSRSRGDDMWSWYVGYVKRSRPHVYLPRSPRHLQPIPNVHFNPTAEHTNRDREIITQRA
jgi:hypothetical protein